MRDPSARPSFRGPGILLGLGLGGFIDGIVLHQILQWHHILTSTGDHPASTVEGLEANILADGLFHAATWIFVALGLLTLWNVVARNGVRAYGRSLLGWVLTGWGIFNVVEGIINHHILQIHHVKGGTDETLFDIGFLFFG